MGWVNGIVWISSSRFEPVARICCCLDSEPRVGDRTYLFTNMRENGVEATGGALKRMRKLSSDTTGEYYATVTNTNAPAVNEDKATLQIRRIAGDPILKVEQEDSIAVNKFSRIIQSIRFVFWSHLNFQDSQRWTIHSIKKICF